jgi:hypothetical protein
MVKLTRTEVVQINMELDKAAYDRHEAEVALLCPELHMNVLDGDTLKVNYKFFIDYFGDVAAKLAAIKTICVDSDVVTKADCDELIEGRILVYEALRELDNVIRIVKERNEDPFAWRRNREPNPEPEPKRTWREWWRGG